MAVSLGRLKARAKLERPVRPIEDLCSVWPKAEWRRIHHREEQAHQIANKLLNKRQNTDDGQTQKKLHETRNVTWVDEQDMEEEAKYQQRRDRKDIEKAEAQLKAKYIRDREDSAEQRRFDMEEAKYQKLEEAKYHEKKERKALTEAAADLEAKYIRDANEGQRRLSDRLTDIEKAKYQRENYVDVDESQAEWAARYKKMNEAQRFVTKAKALQFCNTDRVHRIHSALKSTEALKGWEAQIKLKGRMQKRHQVDLLMEEEKRKNSVVKHQKHLKLWRDNREEKLKEEQSIREIVYDGLQATQQDQERKRLIKENEFHRRDIAELGVKTNAMLTALYEHQDRMYLRKQQQAQKDGRRLCDADLEKQMAEKKARERKLINEQIEFATKRLERECEEESQFQQYAGHVINAAINGKREIFALRKAAREGIGGGQGPILPGL